MSDSHAGPELVFFASLLLHQLDNHTHCHKKGERQSISLRKKKNHFCDSTLLNEARPFDSSGTT